MTDMMNSMMGGRTSVDSRGRRARARGGGTSQIPEEVVGGVHRGDSNDE